MLPCPRGTRSADKPPLLYCAKYLAWWSFLLPALASPEEAELVMKAPPVAAPAISPDAARVAVADIYDTITVYNVKTKQPVTSLGGIP